MRKNTPQNFTAPFEAYEAKYHDERKSLVCCFIGVQDRGGDVQRARTSARALLQRSDGPAVIEQGWHDDTAGARTHVLMAYWRDPSTYLRWNASARPDQWVSDDPDDALTGRFLESALIAPRGLDTLIADPQINWGLAKLADEIAVTPYHGYWGGTRDRMLESEFDPLLNPDGADLPVPPRMLDGVGQVIDVLMPRHAVLARGGPDWQRCRGAELVEFRSSVYPAYVRGGRYLASHAKEAGCYSAYLLQETDSDDRPVKRNHLIAYFTELSHLESWTRSHPTHLEIFGRFMSMVKNLNGRLPEMNLYHEISVIPERGLTATYANCLPQTGLLRFGTPR